ncbi:MAG: hypothetical protein WCB46_06515, partial [Methanoregula sp.]
MSGQSKTSKKKSIADELMLRPRKMNGRPRKIGIMNPYMLVHLLSTSPSKSLNRLSPLERLGKINLHDKIVLRTLNAHFRRNNQITTYLSYRQLFDPKISPLYKPPKGIAVGSGKPNPFIINPPTEYSLPPGTVYVKEPRHGKSEIFGDIIQGAAVDCYFHAALHSQVWVNWTNFPPPMDQIKFSGNTYNVEATFLLDVMKKPVGAQLSLNNEYWGCAWEKAYAEFKNLARSTYSKNTKTLPPYDPNVLAFV